MNTTVAQLANEVSAGRITAESAVPLMRELIFPKGVKYVSGKGRGKDIDEVWRSMAEGDTSERDDNSFDHVRTLHLTGEISKAQYNVLSAALTP